MGRSVSTPPNVIRHINYAHLADNSYFCTACGHTQDTQKDCEACGEPEEHVVQEEVDFQFLLEDFAQACKAAFPSLSESDKWLGRSGEDRAVLENGYVYVGVSEYCGVVAMWMAEKDVDACVSRQGMRDRWLASVDKTFEKICANSFGQTLVKVGSFSNGESFYSHPCPQPS